MVLLLLYFSTGVDEILAKHIAHLFIRDPVFMFAESLEHEDIENESDHFEVWFVL